MRAVLQRVKEASVSIDKKRVSSIGYGLCIFLGIEKGDVEKDADYLCPKILNLRIFEDENGKMNRSVCEIKGEILIVSQFTLFASCRKGNRPSFDAAAEPETALKLYNYFVEKISENKLVKIQTGKFAADMEVDIVNDGPVTIIVDS